MRCTRGRDYAMGCMSHSDRNFWSVARPIRHCFGSSTSHSSPRANRAKALLIAQRSNELHDQQPAYQSHSSPVLCENKNCWKLTTTEFTAYSGEHGVHRIEHAHCTDSGYLLVVLRVRTCPVLQAKRASERCPQTSNTRSETACIRAPSLLRRFSLLMHPALALLQPLGSQWELTRAERLVTSARPAPNAAKKLT